MKTRLLLFSISFLCSFFHSYGQNKRVTENEYFEYFKLPRELLYVHLNKTTFLTGEEIWFKGYSYDQKNQLSAKATTNINIGIYDHTGKQLKKALFLAKNGITKGSILLDSTFVSGTYYLKAQTNWMKNFKENNAYIQKIKIISQKEAKKNTLNSKEHFDFQILPEGGHIIANTKNNIGFKVADAKGRGFFVSGIVYDESQQQVSTFKSNQFGMGKFLFHPKADQKYTAEIQLENGSILTKTLPSIKKRGISMILNNPFLDKVIISFNTNTETLSTNRSKKYKILIHQNGNLKTIPLSFDNTTQKSISILKKDLFKGTNTITVLDNNGNPILERIFFNDYFLKKTNINISKLNTINDSILVSINELNLNARKNISISILPEMTKSYNPSHNILSSFYLKPYIKGVVQNPQYYFQNMNRKKKNELDILLLTQGWSRYDWKDIFHNKPRKTNHFENGITINGKVNKPSSGIDRLFLYGTKHHSAQFIPLDKNQQFSIANFFLEEDEEIRFSYISKKGIFKKPNMYLRFSVSNKEDQISEVFLNTIQPLNNTSSNFSLPKNFFLDDTEKLEEVVIEKKRDNRYKDPILINGTVTQITLEEYKRFPNITDFIQYNGYDVSESLGRVFITSRRRLRVEV